MCAQTIRSSKLEAEKEAKARDVAIYERHESVKELTEHNAAELNDLNSQAGMLPTHPTVCTHTHCHCHDIVAPCEPVIGHAVNPCAMR